MEQDYNHVHHDGIREAALNCTRNIVIGKNIYNSEFACLVSFMTASKFLPSEFPDSISKCMERNEEVISILLTVLEDGEQSHLIAVWLQDIALVILELLVYSDSHRYIMSSVNLVDRVLKVLFQLFRTRKKHQILLLEMLTHLLRIYCCDVKLGFETINSPLIDGDNDAITDSSDESNSEQYLMTSSDIIMPNLSLEAKKMLHIVIDHLINAMKASKSVLRRNVIPRILKLLSVYVRQLPYNCEENNSSIRGKVWSSIEAGLLDDSPIVRKAVLQFIDQVYVKQEPMIFKRLEYLLDSNVKNLKPIPCKVQCHIIKAFSLSLNNNFDKSIVELLVRKIFNKTNTSTSFSEDLKVTMKVAKALRRYIESCINLSVKDLQQCINNVVS